MSPEAAKQPGPFISYSRKDLEFVRRVDGLLRDRGRDAWVDLDDILPSAEWTPEIRAGIDAAPAVLFVLSPDAVSSAECTRELDYAVAQHKRLIPLLYRPVDANTVVEAVRRLNWIDVLDPTALEKKADVLIAALDMDLEWVRAHSRLLVRAGEWENKGRDPSLLLGGADLDRYEQELAEIAEAQTPQPTALQRRFVAASRQAETRRQGFLLTAISVVSVVIALLAIVAVRQWLEAKRQLRTAVSRSLAAQSLKNTTEPTGRRDVGLLQAVAATEADATSEARQSLWQALLETNRVERFVPTDETLLAVAVSPDGRVVATGGFDGEVGLWDARTLQRIASRVQEEGGVKSMAFSPDGRILATGAGTGVALRDPRTAEVRSVLDGGEGERVTAVAWHPSGRTLFSASINDSSITVWDIANGRRQRAFQAHENGIRAIAVGPDGRTIATAGDGDENVRLWDLDTGSAQRVLSGHEGTVRSVAYSHDGGLLAAGGDDGALLVWNAHTGERLHALKGQPGWIDPVAFSPDGRWLASGNNARTIFLWPLRGDGRPEPLIGHTNSLIGLAFAPDGRSLFSVAFDDTFIAWNTSQPRLRASLRGHRGSVRTVAVSRDGSMIASGGDDGVVLLWNRADGSVNGRFEGHRGSVRTLAFSPDSTLLASGSDDDRRIILWDVVARRQHHELEAECEVRSVDISPDGALLAAGCEGRRAIQLWDVATGMRRAELDGHDGGVAAIVFSHDGKTLVSGGDVDQAIRFWDVATGRQVRAPMAGRGPVAEIAIDPRGTMLASAAHGFGELALRDLRYPDKPLLATDDPGGDNRVAFSPDGKVLAYTSGELRTTIVLWDIERSSVQATLEATATTLGLSFVPDGQHLVSGHSSGEVVVWNVDVGDWPRRACEIANRNLTHEEWKASVGDSLSYRAPCPEPATPAAPRSSPG